MLKMLLRRRTKLSKDGVIVISDMGNFFHPVLRIHELFKHEEEISSAGTLPFKFYCSYTAFDLNSFSKEKSKNYCKNTIDLLIYEARFVDTLIERNNRNLIACDCLLSDIGLCG